ncbi:undecaprenyl-diphosphatase [Priestia megaterium]|uniref:undecaprenyl-diphosphatase n=1 Tax=Priestia megaterium TaxID=1404 RepID=UPI002E1D31A6|nr:undecaprenyl-diphosphatase [Priestia megaterium]
MNYKLFEMIHGMAGHNHLLDSFMIFCTNNAIYMFGLALLLMWILGNEEYKRSAFYAGITGVMALLMNYLITLVYYEPRPFVAHHVHTLLSHAADASFPSDHTTGACTIAFMIWLRHRKVGTFMIILGLLTGFSRIWVGLHYPFDVLGSIVVAIITAFVTYKFSYFLNPFVTRLISIYDFLIRRKAKSSKSSVIK